MIRFNRFKEILCSVASNDSNNTNSLALWNSAGMLIPGIISFALMPIFTRLLGTDGYGLWSVYLAWLSIFTLITGLNTDSTASVAQIDFNNEERKQYRSAAMGISASSACVVSAFCIIFRKPLINFLEIPMWMLMLLILTSFGTFCMNFTVNYHIYERSVKASAFVRVSVMCLSLLLSLVLMLIPYFTEIKYIGRIIGYSIPYVMCGITVLIYTFKKGGLPRIDKYGKYCLKTSIPLMFNSLGSIVLAQSDRIMLQKLLENNSAVGIYSAAYTLASVLGMLFPVFDNTWVSFFYTDMKEGNYESIRSKSANYRFIFTGITCGFILLSPEVFGILTGDGYETGRYILPVFASTCFLTFCNTFPINYLVYCKKPKYIAFSTLSSCLINILLNYYLIPNYGIIGAGIASLTAYILQFLFNWLIAAHLNKAKWIFRFCEIAACVFIVALISVVFYFTIDFWYIRVILALLIGSILFCRFIKKKTII